MVVASSRGRAAAGAAVAAAAVAGEAGGVGEGDVSTSSPVSSVTGVHQSSKPSFP